MDVSRMLTAAAAVLLVAGCAALVWHCRARGLIGRRRVVALVGAGVCAAAAIACLCHSFMPRVHYVQQEASVDETQEQAVEVSEEGGRVSYSTASLGVEPAVSTLPEREDEQGEPAAGQGQAEEETPAQEEPAAGQGQVAEEEQEAPAATQEAAASAQNVTTANAGTAAAASAVASTASTAAATTAAVQAPAALDVSEPTGTARVDFVDGGSAVCSLVTLPTGARVLVDAGDADHAEQVAARLSELGVTSLDALVLTAPSDASMGGAARLLSHVRVSRVLLPSSASGTLVDGVCSEASRTGASVERASAATAVLEASGCTVEALPAGTGLVAEVSYGGRVAALTSLPASDVAAVLSGRVDVLACGSASGDAARGLWPSVVAAGSEADAATVGALAMAEVLDASVAGASATISAAGGVAASGSDRAGA